ncbi:hypothetical protein ACIBCT_21095 [Streptosporangium sp. NPDC050855]|uniref:hypothetical protein n=1 Tax=Streptosporangium sp. NPDC050855 TaxID=3366194 RepID=UPI0037A97EC3
MGMVVEAAATGGAALAAAETVGAGMDAAHATTAGLAMRPVVADGAGTDAVADTTLGETALPAEVSGAGTLAVAATTSGVAVASTEVDAVGTQTTNPRRASIDALATTATVPVEPPVVRCRVDDMPEVRVPDWASPRLVCGADTPHGVRVAPAVASPKANRTSQSSVPIAVVDGVVTFDPTPEVLFADAVVVASAPCTAMMMTTPLEPLDLPKL